MTSPRPRITAPNWPRQPVGSAARPGVRKRRGPRAATLAAIAVALFATLAAAGTTLAAPF